MDANNLKINSKARFPVCPTRSESDALKGVFILFVVLAHNAYLVPTATVLQHYLYQFHFFTFFILPFLYPSRRLSVKRINDYIFRYYVPYIWFYAATYITYHIVKAKSSDLLLFLVPFFSGEISGLKEATGFHFLWFLPAFAAFTLLKDIGFHSRRWVRMLFFVFGLLVHFMGFYGGPGYYSLRTVVPLAIVQAFYFYPIAYITLLLLRYIPHFRLLPEHPPVYRVYCVLLAAFIFFLLSFDFAFDGKLGASSPVAEIRNMLLPVFFFIIFYFSRVVWSGSKLLKAIGKFSLQIYLLHVFVYNILVIFAAELSTNMNLALGALLFLLTLIISYIVAYYVNSTLLIRKIVFPRELFKLNNVQ